MKYQHKVFFTCNINRYKQFIYFVGVVYVKDLYIFFCHIEMYFNGLLDIDYICFSLVVVSLRLLYTVGRWLHTPKFQSRKEITSI